MAEFSAAANLDVVVDQSSLRSAKREIERGIGDVSVSVDSAVPDGGRRTGAGGGRAMGGKLDSIGDDTESLVALAEDRNDQLERLGGGGGGGGGGFVPTGGGGGGGGGIFGGARDALAGFGAGNALARLGPAAFRLLGRAGGTGFAQMPFTPGSAPPSEEAHFERMQNDPFISGVQTVMGAALGDDPPTLPEPPWLSDLLGWTPDPVEIQTGSGASIGGGFSGAAAGSMSTGEFDRDILPSVGAPRGAETAGAGVRARRQAMGRLAMNENRGQSVNVGGVTVDVGGAQGVTEQDIRRIVEQWGRNLEQDLERRLLSGSETAPRTTGPNR